MNFIFPDKFIREAERGGVFLETLLWLWFIWGVIIQGFFLVVPWERQELRALQTERLLYDGVRKWKE